MSNKIKKQLDTIAASLSSIESLRSELYPHISAIVKRCLMAEHSRVSGFVYSNFNGTCVDWKIDAEGNIEGTWERHWEKGGFNGGSMTIPSECVWSEAALADFEAKRAAEKLQQKEEKAAKDRQNDLEQLRKLKEKLGE